MMNFLRANAPQLGRLLMALPVLALLAACTEDEKACSDRISADFQREAEFWSAKGRHDLAVEALESNITAMVIYSDDDRSICDYVTAGTRLERK